MSLGLFFIWPLFTAVFLHFLTSLRLRETFTHICFGILGLILAVEALRGLPVVVVAGGWPHFAGIQWTLDEWSWALCLLALIVSYPVARGLAQQKDASLAFFYVALAAVLGAYLTADLFNLYVMLEILLMATLLLLQRPDRPRALRLFFWMGMIGSIFYLLAVALLYQNTGTLNMIEASLRWENLSASTQVALVAMFSLAFLLKAAIFPFCFWMPESYGAASEKIQPWLNAIPTKLGLVLLYKFVSLIAIDTFLLYAPCFEVVALITIALGAAGFLHHAQKNVGPMILNFFNLMHLGTLLLVLSIAPQHHGFLFYLLFDTLIVSALFHVFQNQLRTSAKSRRAWMVILASAIGLPPLAGFLIKFEVLRGLTISPLAMVVIIFTSLLDLLVLVRIFTTLPAVAPDSKPTSFALRWHVAWIGVVTLLLWTCADKIQFRLNPAQPRTRMFEQIYQRLPTASPSEVTP